MEARAGTISARVIPVNNRTLSIIIPAYNEQDHVQDAIKSVTDIGKPYVNSYEVLVINDGSTDQTAQIVQRLANGHPEIRVIHNSQNRGLGYSLGAGFRAATKDYVMWFPGDNSVKKESLKPLLEQFGQADITVTYMSNLNERNFLRKHLSKTFTAFMNGLFGLNLKYFNGLFVYPVSLLKSMHFVSTGHAVFAELLIRSLKTGHSVDEVPFLHKVESESRSKALSIKNFASVSRTIFILFWDIYIRRKPLG